MPIINTPSEETPSTRDAAYVERMVAKAEGRAPVTPAKPVVPPVETPPKDGDPPKKFAQKYDTIEALEAGYLELQKAYSKKTTAPAKETPVVPPAVVPAGDPPKPDLEIPAVVPKTPEEEAAAAALESKGLDFTAFSTEYDEKGELSPESYASLEKAGMPKAMVDSYIEGQKLIANQLVTRVYDTAGGKDDYQKLIDWAAANSTAEQKTAYNAALASNDINQVLLAVKGLQSDYFEANGKAPVLITGDDPTPDAGEVYNSLAEMKSDMKDPRYQKDPAFRNKVREKLGRSSIM